MSDVRVGLNMAEKPIIDEIVLAVFPAEEDRTELATIFTGSNWKLRFARTVPQTQTVLSKSSVRVIISEGWLSDDYCWKDLLLELQKMEHPPPLIVADRLADERLWAEVLNLGGYDLLAKPFDAKEILHVVTTACRRSGNERGTTPRKPATHIATTDAA
jgi:DNA-binding NtrC family response regulator